MEFFVLIDSIPEGIEVINRCTTFAAGFRRISNIRATNIQRVLHNPEQRHPCGLSKGHLVRIHESPSRHPARTPVDWGLQQIGPENIVRKVKRVTYRTDFTRAKQ